MSHSRRQSRPPPKNPLPARFLRGAFGFWVWFLFPLSCISYLISRLHQLSHSIDEQIGGQLRAGLILTHVFEDTNGSGNLHAHNLPTFWATRAVKPEK